MPETISQEDALHFLISSLRNGNCGSYGYGVYLRGVIGGYCAAHPLPPDPQHGLQRGYSSSRDEPRIVELSPAFMAAAWELCRLGVLRPGIERIDGQIVDQGSAGGGFSITPKGRQWLKETSLGTFSPVEANRTVEMLGRFRQTFGDVYYERAVEAVRCYHAQAYLACAAMSGAAATAILSAAQDVRYDQVVDADRPEWNEAIAAMLANLDEKSQAEFRSLSMLLAYWGEGAINGGLTANQEAEAYTSLMLLYRLALWANEHWNAMMEIVDGPE